MVVLDTAPLVGVIDPLLPQLPFPTFTCHVDVSESVSVTSSVVKWLPLSVNDLLLLPTYPTVETSPLRLLCVADSSAAGTVAVTVKLYVFPSQTKLTVSVLVAPALIAASGVNVTVNVVKAPAFRLLAPI